MRSLLVGRDHVGCLYHDPTKEACIYLTSKVISASALRQRHSDRAYFFRVAARQHLGHQAIVVRRLVARMGLLKRLPVVSKDLLEDIPVPRGGCHHRIAPSGGDQSVAMERLEHAAAPSLTPRTAPPMLP